MIWHSDPGRWPQVPDPSSMLNISDGQEARASHGSVCSPKKRMFRYNDLPHDSNRVT